jgi:hypothetical protein
MLDDLPVGKDMDACVYYGYGVNRHVICILGNAILWETCGPMARALPFCALKIRL